MRIMEGVHFPVSAASIFGICLHLVINGPCMAYQELQTGTDDTMIIVAGERLALECISSELPVEEGYIVLWRRAKFFVGGCDMNRYPGQECYKYEKFRNDRRISLVQREGKTLQLLISNTTIYDGGFYECGREHEGGNISSFLTLYSVQVAVVPLQEIYNTHVSTFPGMSGNTIQFLHIVIHDDVLEMFALNVRI